MLDLCVINEINVFFSVRQYMAVVVDLVIIIRLKEFSTSEKLEIVLLFLS